ncbi:MAG: DoxX family protein [Acidimicrobiia bacterium]
MAAAGLVLPAGLNQVRVLAAWAAAGLLILMLGAAFTHARRNERFMIVPTVMLAMVAAICLGKSRAVPFLNRTISRMSI